MQCLREVQLEIPRRSPLSAELNDASAGRIGVPVAHFVVTLQCLCVATTARVDKETEQNVFCCCNGLKDIAVATHRPAPADAGCVVVDSVLRDLLCCL